MRHNLLIILAFSGIVTTSLAKDKATIKCPSPNGHYALRLTPKDDETYQWDAELIEKSSGKVMTALGTASPDHLAETVLRWSVDSKWVAYGTRTLREGQINVFALDGAKFEELALPEDLPDPDINFGKHADNAVKNYGGVVVPLRWLKPGVLELSSDAMMMSRESSRTYVGVVQFTVAFDAQHHAKVRKIGKTKTTVD